VQHWRSIRKPPERLWRDEGLPALPRPTALAGATTSTPYDSSSREGRITRLLWAALAGGGRVSRAGMERIQCDAALVDAQVLEPFIQRAYGDAATPGAPPRLAALAADPALAEALRRLAAWDATTQTGIRDGYDASEVAGVRGTASADEIADSVAATIVALWRGQILWRWSASSYGAGKPPRSWRRWAVEPRRVD
jgi:penicillin amidase